MNEWQHTCYVADPEIKIRCFDAVMCHNHTYSISQATSFQYLRGCHTFTSVHVLSRFSCHCACDILGLLSWGCTAILCDSIHWYSLLTPEQQHGTTKTSRWTKFSWPSAFSVQDLQGGLLCFLWFFRCNPTHLSRLLRDCESLH